MTRIICKKVKEGFAYGTTKIAVVTSKTVEEIYEALLDNYNKVLDYAENKSMQEFSAKVFRIAS